MKVIRIAACVHSSHRSIILSQICPVIFWSSGVLTTIHCSKLSSLFLCNVQPFWNYLFNFNFMHFSMSSYWEAINPCKSTSMSLCYLLLYKTLPYSFLTHLFFLYWKFLFQYLLHRNLDYPYPSSLYYFFLYMYTVFSFDTESSELHSEFYSGCEGSLQWHNVYFTPFLVNLGYFYCK